VGDARVVCNQLLAELARQIEAGAVITDRSGWFAQIAEWKQRHPFFYHEDGEVIKPQYVIHELHRITKGKAVLSADVGQHQMWTAQLYGFDSPRNWLNSGGLGAMGYGFPAAMGAAVARQKDLVVAVVGDGGFQMTFNELATVKQYNLPVKVLLINNGYLGMVRQWQEQFYAHNYSHSDLCIAPDFVKLSEAFDVPALRATKSSEVTHILEKGLNIPGPVVIEMQVAREENVFPIVPAGAALKDMILA